MIFPSQALTLRKTRADRGAVTHHCHDVKRPVRCVPLVAQGLESSGLWKYIRYVKPDLEPWSTDDWSSDGAMEYLSTLESTCSRVAIPSGDAEKADNSDYGKLN